MKKVDKIKLMVMVILTTMTKSIMMMANLEGQVVCTKLTTPLRVKGGGSPLVPKLNSSSSSPSLSSARIMKK